MAVAVSSQTSENVNMDLGSSQTAPSEHATLGSEPHRGSEPRDDTLKDVSATPAPSLKVNGGTSTFGEGQVPNANGVNVRSVALNGLYAYENPSLISQSAVSVTAEHPSSSDPNTASSLASQHLLDRATPPSSATPLPEASSLPTETAQVDKVQTPEQYSYRDSSLANGQAIGGTATDSSPVPTAGEPTKAVLSSTEGHEGIGNEIDSSSAHMGDGKMTDAPLSMKAPTIISATQLPHHPSVPVLDNQHPELPMDPAPSPAAPGSLQPARDDEMDDAPLSPGKVARLREDEDVRDEPAAKRSKTDDEGSSVPQFKVPDLPPAPSTEAHPQSQDNQQRHAQSMTTAQQKFLQKLTSSLKRLKGMTPFLKPVDPVALNLPTYFDYIKTPMDLGTLDHKLKTNQYSTVDAFVRDANQIVENSVTFNGSQHPITQLAIRLQEYFNKQMAGLPGPDVKEPTSAEKKAKKISVGPAPKAPSRRESRSSLGGGAPSPTVPIGSPQTFALGPQGVPLIRRDSTMGDGRPRRAIHPPPPKDLPYANQKPKKKKYQWELKFCQEVINEMNKPKYQTYGWPFYNPVDPVALNIPNYHSVIKKPMDLGTINSKLTQGEYGNAKEFEDDIRLMFANCYKFNPPSDFTNNLGHQFEDIFNDKWAEKKSWLEDHVPASGQQSPRSSPELDEEDDEDEAEEEGDEEIQLSNLQKQIAAMSKQVEMIQKKKSSPPVTGKKANKGSKIAKKEGKKSGAAPVKTERKPSSKGLKKEKLPYVTYEQKQDISNRINSLPENRMATALKIIRDNMPNLPKGVQEDEIELDIDELPSNVLHKLLGFVRKYAPLPNDEPASRPPPSSQTAAGHSRPKKNKPMSKVEQEAKISEIKGKLSGFQNPSFEDSEQLKEEEPANETSGDEDDSESEEE